jgi:hypothetical protein
MLKLIENIIHPRKVKIYFAIWVFFAIFAKIFIMETKVCNRCHEELPIEEFYQVL